MEDWREKKHLQDESPRRQYFTPFVAVWRERKRYRDPRNVFAFHHKETATTSSPPPTPPSALLPHQRFRARFMWWDIVANLTPNYDKNRFNSFLATTLFHPLPAPSFVQIHHNCFTLSNQATKKGEERRCLILE